MLRRKLPVLRLVGAIPLVSRESGDIMWCRKVVGAALVSVVLVLGGCSLLFVQGPPGNHASLPTVDCSYRNTAPVVDTVLAGLAVLDLAIAAGSTEQQWEDLNLGQKQSTVLTLALVRLALYGGSAIYGYSKTSSCRQAREAAQRRQGWPAPGAAPVAPVPAAPVAPGAAPVAPGAAPAAPVPAAPVVPAPAAPAPTALQRRVPRIDSLAMRTATSRR